MKKRRQLLSIMMVFSLMTGTFQSVAAADFDGSEMNRAAETVQTSLVQTSASDQDDDVPEILADEETEIAMDTAERAELIVESIETEEEIASDSVGLAEEADQGAAQTFQPETVFELAPADTQQPDSDTLFDEYVFGLFYGNTGISLYGFSAGDRLTGIEKKVYDKMKSDVTEVASGKRSSTIFAITADELGEEQFFDPVMSNEELEKLNENLGTMLNHVIASLKADLPYELYWYNSAATGTELRVEAVSNGASGTRLMSISFCMPVSADYQDQTAETPLYQVDVSRVVTAQKAAEKARSIVNENKEKSDYEKLNAYRIAICDLVSYNDEAADGVGQNAEISDMNPWQLVWVFDGDPDTNVVCEGYARAFRYLCDLTEFESDAVACYCVTGVLENKGESGAHMWNIVTMEDGLNYLVDVTNCDEGTVGAPDLLFLAAPASGDPEMGYYFALSNGETVQYFYDSDQQSLYGSSILTLASDNYNSGHLYTITFEWSEDYSSCLAIRCCTECGQTSKVNCEVSVTTEAADCTSEGKEIYTAAAFGSQDTKTVTLPAKGHRAASPVKEHSTAATWQAPASWEEVSYCSVCGAELNRVKKSGKAALTPTYQLTADNLILQTGQKTNVLKVTDLLSGDFVASWTSSNTKIVKVSGTADGSAKVTAGKKTGTATITIRLASKAEITVKVKVQKQKVATKSVKLSSRSITLKKGQKLKLAPVVTPLTSQEKVTYTSSNKKVARVTGSGVISAGKIGTAKITVKSGKKKVVCKVRVTK